MVSSSTGRKRPGNPRLALLLVPALILCGILLAACGSSSSSSSSGSTSTASGSAGESEEAASGGPSLTKVYAPGVPNLKELYAGSEEPPPTTGPTAKPGANVIWIACGLESPGCAGPAEAFTEAGKALGWNTKVLDGKLNVNNGYSNAIRTAIAAHPEAIVTHGINCNEVKQPLEEAKDAGILIAEGSGIDCDDPRIGGPKLYSVPEEFSKNAKNTQQFYEQFGENQADYAIDATEGKAKVILVEFQGLFGENQGEAWKREFEKCSECEILETIPFEASELAPNGPAYQRFSTALVKYPEANAAVLAFDTNVTYTGMAKEVVDAGRAESMVVVGGEGFAEALQLVREGKGDTAEGGAYDNAWSAWAIADEVNRALNEQPAVPEGVGFKVVDKDHNMPPAGQDYTTSINYKQAYEEVWKGK
jgi:ribose transport system substrate-binding protein